MIGFNPTTVSEVYAKILEYCQFRFPDFRGEVQGYWGQTSYKGEYFEIFANAYYNGLCGEIANSKAWRAALKELRPLIQGKRQTRSRTTKPQPITGPRIRRHLEQQWFNNRKRIRRSIRGMVDDLAQWWDEWTYAWDAHPIPLPRKYYRKQRQSK